MVKDFSLKAIVVYFCCRDLAAQRVFIITVTETTLHFWHIRRTPSIDSREVMLVSICIASKLLPTSESIVMNASNVVSALKTYPS